MGNEKVDYVDYDQFPVSYLQKQGVDEILLKGLFQKEPQNGPKKAIFGVKN